MGGTNNNKEQKEKRKRRGGGGSSVLSPVSCAPYSYHARSVGWGTTAGRAVCVYVCLCAITIRSAMPAVVFRMAIDHVARRFEHVTSLSCSLRSAAPSFVYCCPVRVYIQQKILTHAHTHTHLGQALSRSSEHGELGCCFLAIEEDGNTVSNF